MKPTNKIRFTAPQIAFLMRAYPNYNLDHLSELSFEFDIGTIKAGGNVGHDYAGGGLARLYETARRKLADRKTSATVLQFPNGAIKKSCASRVGLTPSPTCLPGQGGSRKGMRPFGNETGRAIVSPPR
jgi:hypothetical protein